jgi:hypothetical protein
MPSLHRRENVPSERNKRGSETVEPRSDWRVEFTGRLERREIDALYASIDLLNYLVLKLLVIAVVCLLHS